MEQMSMIGDSYRQKSDCKKTYEKLLNKFITILTCCDNRILSANKESCHCGDMSF